MPVDPARTTFIDLGCGKGRALVLAAQFGFRRVIGVEFDPVLAEAARHNADAWARRSSSQGSIEVVTGDARQFPFPPEPSLVFLFNPFGEAVTAPVVANLEQSLVDRPRDVHVLYLNPRAPAPWLSSQAFEPLPLPDALATPGRPGLFRGLRRYELGSDLDVLALASNRGETAAG